MFINLSIILNNFYSIKKTDYIIDGKNVVILHAIIIQGGLKYKINIKNAVSIFSFIVIIFINFDTIFMLQ